MSRILQPGVETEYSYDNDSMDTISRAAYSNGMAEHWPSHSVASVPSLPHNGRVGSAELEQLIKTLDEEDNKHQSNSLSITPSWNFANDGTPIDRDSLAFRNIIRDSNITQDYSGGSVYRRNSSNSHTSKPLSFTLPTLQTNDFEVVNNHRPMTRPPPPLAAESPVRKQGTGESKFSWAAVGGSREKNDVMAERGGSTPVRSVESPNRDNVGGNMSDGDRLLEEDKENNAGEYFSTIYKDMFGKK
jgi:hypothetical protein